MGKTIGLTFPEKPAAQFICEVCGKQYKREQDLVKHMEKEHGTGDTGTTDTTDTTDTTHTTDTTDTGTDTETSNDEE